MATRKATVTKKATATRKQAPKAKTAKVPRDKQASQDKGADKREQPAPPAQPAVAAPPAVPAPPTQAPPQREKLILPKGALIALRKSGGTAADMREVIVYPDGRVTYDTHQKPDLRRPRKLSDANIAELSHTLDRTGFFRIESAPGEPGDNQVTFEIAARRGPRTNHVEYYGENTPEALTPLVDRLTPLLPAE